MRERLTATLLALPIAAAALVGCSGSDESKPEPSKPTHSAAAPTTEPALSKAEIGRRCANAIADQLANEADSDDDNRPAECETLSDSEYADAAFKGTQQANQAARDELQEQIDEAAEEDAVN